VEVSPGVMSCEPGRWMLSTSRSCAMELAVLNLRVLLRVSSPTGTRFMVQLLLGRATDANRSFV
jgi:hypothetical protein